MCDCVVGTCMWCVCVCVYVCVYVCMYMCKLIQNYINVVKNLCKWFRANQISLNSSKTELLIFRHPNKKINDDDFKIKMNGKKLYPSKFVKYLGVLINDHLNFGIHINSISIKLARATGVLAKIRHVTKDILRTIYFGIFSSILNMGAKFGDKLRVIIRLERLHNKAIKMINFASMCDKVTPVYKVTKILKLSDNIRLLNFLLVFDDVNDKLPLVLKNTF